jgi:hypothetical protein
VEPQRDLGAQGSPSRMRSPDLKIATESLVNDAKTATPPLAADERVETPLPSTNSRKTTPPHTGEAGAGGALGDVGTSASPWVIDVEPITWWDG